MTLLSEPLDAPPIVMLTRGKHPPAKPGMTNEKLSLRVVSVGQLLQKIDLRWLEKAGSLDLILFGRS